MGQAEGCEAHRSMLRSACHCCRQEAESARREASEASQEAERLQSALREVRGVLAQRKADASAQSSQSAVVQALLAAKAAGDIPGIHGRLGECRPVFSLSAEDSVMTWGNSYLCLRAQLRVHASRRHCNGLVSLGQHSGQTQEVERLRASNLDAMTF